MAGHPLKMVWCNYPNYHIVEDNRNNGGWKESADEADLIALIEQHMLREQLGSAEVVMEEGISLERMLMLRVGHKVPVSKSTIWSWFKCFPERFRWRDVVLRLLLATRQEARPKSKTWS